MIGILFGGLWFDTGNAFLGNSMRRAKPSGPVDCSLGSYPVGTVCIGGALYLGIIEGGRYMITPGGCTDSTTPTCDGGTDATTKAWGPSTIDVPRCQTLTVATTKSAARFLGNVNTTAIINYYASGTFAAAKYCDDMSFGGYTDWYLPSKSELAYIYCKAQVGSHNIAYPQEDPNCADYGGKQSILKGFAAANYWASTEVATDTGWFESFSTGVQNSSNKTTANRLRCVRRFFTNNPCPANYVLVPALNGYTSSDFCVAKYEMKDVGGVATSQASGTPWVSIPAGATENTADSAWQKCWSLGTRYDLISNAQWQTIARNIASVGSNWSSGTVGDGAINQGHSDGSPASNLESDPDDNNACFGTEQTCDASTWNSQRRTHTLSNGGVVWDIAGNVWEWTREVYGNMGVSPTIVDWVEFDTLSTKNRMLFGPSNATWNSAQGIGRVHGGPSPGGAVYRGGVRSGASYAGIFSANLANSSSYSDTFRGFRCVYTP